MITLHNVGNPGEALQYFSKDNYYTEHQGLEESEWFGKGAEMLGFAGKVEKQQFFETLAGEIEGQRLGKYVTNEDSGEKEREHRPGTDITFSAPKSVSLLAEVAGSQEVREAHEGAVKAALGYIEREYAQTRQMRDGEIETVKTGNLAVAMFRHNTSRDLDPQTHTHAIVMNATKREDGEWRSLTNDEIYKAQRIVGAIYTGELADRLQALGYELRRSDDKGNFEIAGVTREQIEHFSQRRAGIEAALADKGIDIDTATARQKEDATLSTRARKGDVDHVELIQEWKSRAKDVGIDLANIQAKAAEQRSLGGVMRDDRLSGRQAMEFAAAHVIEREAVVSKNLLMQTALEHGAGRVSPKDVEKAFDKLEMEGHLVKLPDGNYTTKKMLGSETWALEQVRDTKGQGRRILGENTVSERLSAAEKQLGINYTAGQREAIVKTLSTHDRFVGVQGLAGSGKTTMLRAVNDLAKSQDWTVRGMAPTGAAAKVLGRETGIQTDTVSMFLIKERQLQRDIEFVQANAAPDFKRKPELWLVDEASFLSQRQKAQIDNMAKKADAKVVYIGDKLQLQAVEAGKPFEMAQSNGLDTAYMTEISRQKTPELRKAVDMIVGRDQVDADGRLTTLALNHNARAFNYLDQVGRVKETKDNPINQLVKDIVALPPAERERTIVITAYNKDRHAINDGVRHELRRLGELPKKESDLETLENKGWSRAVVKEAQYYREGDVVRFGRDYKALDAKKGEYMRVAGVDGAQRGVVVLQKADGSTIAWEPGKHNKVEVYESQQRGLSVGDLIRITRNSEHDLKNGEVGRIIAMEGSKATLELRHGKDVSKHEMDLNQAENKHWDHAYASTVHASQGSTQHRTMFHIRAPEAQDDRKMDKELADMIRVFGDRSFYVGATRASHDIMIYTNDKASAARAVTGQQDKTSAVDVIQKHEREIEQRGAGGRDMSR